jgi:hypothetical protein
VVEDFSKVMKLVHLAMRHDQVDVSVMVPQLFEMKRQAYKDRLTVEAANVGCAGRVGIVPPQRMTQMKEEAETEAAGISNTYNYDLAIAVRTIRTETPSANRNTYAKRLRVWDETRSDWKSKQIALWNNGRWGDVAAQDFMDMNPQVVEGATAIIKPQNRAVCPVCIEWVGKGRMSLQESEGQEWPAHLNCPHYREVTYKKQRVDCDELWVGVPLSAWYDEIGMEKEVVEV